MDFFLSFKNKKRIMILFKLYLTITISGKFLPYFISSISSWRVDIIASCLMISIRNLQFETQKISEKHIRKKHLGVHDASEKSIICFLFSLLVSNRKKNIPQRRKVLSWQIRLLMNIWKSVFDVYLYPFKHSASKKKKIRRPIFV